MTRLERFGWRGEAVPGVARIVSAHGDYYHLVCNETGGEIIARKKKSAFSKRVEAVTEKRGRKIAKIDYSNCIRCYCCQEMCPVKAIEVYRHPLTKLLSGK